MEKSNSAPSSVTTGSGREREKRKWIGKRIEYGRLGGGIITEAGITIVGTRKRISSF